MMILALNFTQLGVCPLSTLKIFCALPERCKRNCATVNVEAKGTILLSPSSPLMGIFPSCFLSAKTILLLLAKEVSGMTRLTIFRRFT
ncbi:hypothetical protein SLE2022_018470 [Rubroshorea leprosula]